ncbi:hypothetical protein [Sphingomonas sp. CFBP9019]|uniref:hypothetical protein n=1 Tax=Sphingomonas sp. CFBP9019 TaxID=3096532 RepID=UPI002A6AFE52|nr:hypothetical protein [Sphingomonas sp. CFBP9019]MDY1006930.1 hypothetical protein [Sphingomonas sp. CFBP9019]
MKRYRTLTAKPGELKAGYGREDRHCSPSLVYVWGGGGAQKPDARVLGSALEDKRHGYAFPSMALEQRPSLIEELEARGYDITTLRFSIRMKETPDTLSLEDAHGIR